MGVMHARYRVQSVGCGVFFEGLLASARLPRCRNLRFRVEDLSIQLPMRTTLQTLRLKTLSLIKNPGALSPKPLALES